MERSAAKLVWEKPKMRAMHGDAANLPRARSGHSLSIVGNTGFLFGGLADGGEAMRVQASALSEMHVVRFGKAEMEWSHLALPASASPLPRWRHTACLHEGGIVVFGGYHTRILGVRKHRHPYFSRSSLRLNDVWVFNTVSVSWEQPHPPGGLETGKDASNCGAWPNLPQPRGGHSAAVCGGGMYVFGGYGAVPRPRVAKSVTERDSLPTHRLHKVPATR
ncbi:hypothetical protein M885DRAFT_439927 [Pelagophyceae sp. CCMP2097]|nr:hypothetical protein M885DRAFT_439927 [Pelagophyceae sp. CCMP2097]